MSAETMGIAGASWLVYAVLALLCFGVVGFLQKLSTNLLSAEAALLWLTVGFLALDPFIYSGAETFHHAPLLMAITALAGLLNALGSWALLASMKAGGKASVVVPMTAVYPLVVVLLAPLLLGEHVTGLQWAGVACGLGAIVLLAE